MKEVLLEYGDGRMAVEVPDDAVVVRAGETFTEPPPLDDPVEATRSALANPLASPPLKDLVGRGARVVIAFPDLLRGGDHSNAHRRVAIPLLLEQLGAAGVDERHVTLVCATGLHRKNHLHEMRAYLGPAVVDRFRGSRLRNHDAEDPAGIVDIGETDDGDVVQVNRAVVEADLTVVLGHTVGNPFGGYSGGWKMPCTGLTTWRSIRCHHTPATLHRADFVPASPYSHFRAQLRAIGAKIEAAMKAPFFGLDAVLDGGSRQIQVAAGRLDDLERASWPAAVQRTEIAVDGEPADILVLGMPRSFHYGPGMGSNPILMLAAIGASIVRAAGALTNGAVVIAASICDGWFNDELFPSYREVYELLHGCASFDEMVRFEEDVANRPDYIHRYRHGFGYHPFHPFATLYMAALALEFTRAIYIVGPRSPGFARGMGCIPVATFKDAMARATRHVGTSPKLLVLPELSTPAVHVRTAKRELV